MIAVPPSASVPPAVCAVTLDMLLNHPLSRFPHLLNGEAVWRLAKIQGAKAWGVLG